MAAVTRRRAGEASGIVARATTDRVLLRAFLEHDRLYAAYAICDLDEREFDKTRWGVAFEGDRPVAVALEYNGLSPQPLFVMGEPAGVLAVLRDVVRPRAAYLACLEAHLASAGAGVPHRARPADGAHVGRPQRLPARARRDGRGSCRRRSAT